jgi:hypothetical protein
VLLAVLKQAHSLTRCREELLVLVRAPGGARLGGVHSAGPLVTVGRVPGGVRTYGATSLSDTSIVHY